MTTIQDTLSEDDVLERLVLDKAHVGPTAAREIANRYFPDGRYEMALNSEKNIEIRRHPRPRVRDGSFRKLTPETGVTAIICRRTEGER